LRISRGSRARADIGAADGQLMVSPQYFYRLGHALHQARVPLLPNLIRRLCFLICKADIPMDCTIAPTVVFGHWGMGVVLSSMVEIEDGVIIYHGVTIGRQRGIDDTRPDDLKRIVIGRKTLIGCHAVILARSGEFRIGHNCEIGAGAVVLAPVPDNSVAVGMPARCFPKPTARVSE
jgi:serine O-acetyltransferase